MSNSTYDSINFRVLIPEIIHLESEHFERAKNIYLQTNDELKKWESHLNSLALVAFKDWLNEKLSQYDLDLDMGIIEDSYYLTAGEFKYCLITVEHVLDEIVSISKSIINVSTMIADFYILIEVLEEEEEVIIKGFLSYENLSNYCCQVMPKLSNDDYYQIPLSVFDSEPNHLLLCHQFAEIAELSPAKNRTNIIVEKVLPEELDIVDKLERKIPKLSQWFKNIFDEGWLTIDKLTKVEEKLAFNGIRKVVSGIGIRRGKLIDLEIQLGKNTVALLVNIVEVTDSKFSILVQLHPTGKNKYLPHHLQLIMFSKAGKILQEVEARTQDNYIQLIPFKGESGKRFSIEVALGNVSVKESFEI